jgi:hypothetical protein
MARAPAPKPSLARRLQQMVAGLTALAVLMALFFALLRWRMNRPEGHLNFDIADVAEERTPGESHE